MTAVKPSSKFYLFIFLISAGKVNFEDITEVKKKCCLERVNYKMTEKSLSRIVEARILWTLKKPCNCYFLMLQNQLKCLHII